MQSLRLARCASTTFPAHRSLLSDLASSVRRRRFPSWLGLALPLLLATRADSDSDVPGGGSDPNGTPGVERLAWMAGEWGFERNGRSVTEIWMPPAGGTMLGMSRTVSGDKTVEYEFLLLRVENSGDIAYVAKPSRQAETSFQLVRASETEAVFENLEHDFPQRILYILQPDGSLLAAIEGERNGETRRIEFPYQRRR